MLRRLTPALSEGEGASTPYLTHPVIAAAGPPSLRKRKEGLEKKIKEKRTPFLRSRGGAGGESFLREEIFSNICTNMAAKKIFSLLPAATEIVSALGLESGLVGRSHECDYPE